jgi:hypothetical protein
LAFDAINSGTHTGTLTVTITANTSESASAVLNASGVGSANYTSINIYPTVSGLTISGNLATPLIDLNGADNITIDGRVNATGNLVDLTITNSSTSNAAGTSTIRYINDATIDIVIPNPERDLNFIESVYLRPGRQVTIRIVHPESALASYDTTAGLLTSSVASSEKILKLYPNLTRSELNSYRKMNQFVFDVGTLLGQKGRAFTQQEQEMVREKVLKAGLSRTDAEFKGSMKSVFKRINSKAGEEIISLNEKTGKVNP